MSVNYGMKSTMSANSYDLYTNIEDKVAKYPDPRIELLKRWDGKNFKKAVTSHEYRWDVRDNRPVKTTTAVAVASDATSMVVTTPGVFNVNDLFQKPSGEQCVVTAVGGGTNITFRSIAGDAEAMDIGVTVKRIGGAAPQGSRAGEMVSSGKTQIFNYTSILKDTVFLSGTQNEALIRGEEGSDELIVRKQKELTESLQSQLVVGKRSADDVNETYTMGGLKYMIDTYASANVIDFGGSASWTADATAIGKLDDGFDLVAAKAFEKPVMYVGAKFMRKFKYIQDDTTQSTFREKARGVGVVRTYMSHLFGDIDVVLIQDRVGIMDDLVFLVDESQVGYKAMRNRGWFTYKLGLDGDRHKWEIIGEYTMKLDIPESAVYFHNLGV